MRLCLTPFHMWRRGNSIHAQSDELILNQTKCHRWTYQHPVQSLSESWLGRKLEVLGVRLPPWSRLTHTWNVPRQRCFQHLKGVLNIWVGQFTCTVDTVSLKGTLSHLVTCPKESLAVWRFLVRTQVRTHNAVEYQANGRVHTTLYWGDKLPTEGSEWVLSDLKFDLTYHSLIFIVLNIFIYKISTSQEHLVNIWQIWYLNEVWIRSNL